MAAMCSVLTGWLQAGSSASCEGAVDVFDIRSTRMHVWALTRRTWCKYGEPMHCCGEGEHLQTAELPGS